MKETVKVNISGHLFSLDIDAYERLKVYLDSIEKEFSDSPDEAKEILEDIEFRIAELLQSNYIKHDKKVIILNDVIEIINLLGTAKDIGGHKTDEEDEKQNFQTQQAPRSNQGRKRLYRDVDHSVLGGVSSGIAVYLGIDPLWVRLLFVVLLFAKLFGLLIYIILWAVIPAAKTTTQKLEMNGEDVNVENIKNSVKNEYNKLKEGVKNISTSKEYKRAEYALSEFLKVFGKLILIIVKAIGVIVLVSLVIGLISVFFGIVVGGAFIFPHNLFNGWFFDWHWPSGFYWPHFTWIGICLFLVIVIPILALFAKMVRLMFNLPNKGGVASALGATVWAISLIMLILLLINDPNRGFFQNTFTSTYTLPVNNSEVLIIDLKDTDNKHLDHYHVFGHHFVWDDDHDELMGTPTIEIHKTDGDEVKMKLKREFFCLDPDKPNSVINRIANYNWSKEDNTIYLAEYFESSELQLWRFPKLKIVFLIPEGTEFYYSEEVSELIKDVVHIEDSEIDNYAEKVLEMRNDDIYTKN